MRWNPCGARSELSCGLRTGCRGSGTRCPCRSGVTGRQAVCAASQSGQADWRGDTGNASASESTVPFGAGIKPSGPGGAGRGRSSGGNTSDTARRGASDTGPYVSRTPVSASVLHAARSQTSSSDGGSILALLGGGVAVLLIGAFGGTLVRRSRRSIPSA